MGIVLEFPEKRFCRNCARAIGSRRLRTAPRARFCADCEKAVRKALPSGDKATRLSMDDIASIMGYMPKNATDTDAPVITDQSKTPEG